MRKKILVGLLLAASIAAVSQGGWFHADRGKTGWVMGRPSPATAWLRDRQNILWPARKIQVYHDTIRHYSLERDGSNSNFVVNLGYWELDSSGILWPNDDLTSLIPSTSIHSQGDWIDVEWYVGTNGILWPKP